MLSFAMALRLLGSCLTDEYTIQYTIEEDGPRTVYKGTAWLHFETTTTPCMEYAFDVPDNQVLAGPAISCRPGEPMLRFDDFLYEGKLLQVSWCRTAHSAMHQPVSTPMHFAFYLMRNSFGPDDVGKLLAEWGSTDSPWDLNNNGTVEGSDLTILIGNWKTDEGTQ